MEGEMATELDWEIANKLATEKVCPLHKTPLTPYEYTMIRYLEAWLIELVNNNQIAWDIIIEKE